ncbi:DUF2092 domain-containing protein [Frigoribacterium sp. CFBP9039]|uniref:LolA family protein n=1 Tax=Frigoribacterium sp. CFBP9029 TaxID=3096541 RepID=UPI002A6999A3|nr:DUF2092 domain-containing protein [Frigoribacterium sp. CFBP9039]MDY0944704.1 DUF2092 domain-containing protein [Frigoribacterium sp. CFBP9039]
MKKSARWIPAAAIPVAVIAAGIVVPSMAANADVDLPDKSPQQVLALAAGSSGVAFSGTVEQTSDLGLPDIPSSLQGGSSAGESTSDALEMLTGSHTAQVFVDGEARQRVQVVDDLSERDVIRDGRDLWSYDSTSKDATHTTLPDASSRDLPDTLADGTAVPQTPSELADAVLDAVGDTTTVTSSDDVSVAGRDAYRVVLTPDDADTLVARATLTVDAETGVPLAVTVDARGQDDPAISVALTSVSFETPASSVFEFTPPADATVTEVAVPAEGREAHGGEHAEPVVIGSGWSTVVGLDGATSAAGSAPADGSASGGDQGDPSALLDQVMTRVDGGRVLQTSLVSVYLGDDGRVFVGAVDAETLQAAVASAPAE